jgi:hypothetical protein
MRNYKAMQAPGNQQYGQEEESEFNGGKEHAGSEWKLLCRRLGILRAKPDCHKTKALRFS